jgi:CRP-like cAMP-binding protein
MTDKWHTHRKNRLLAELAPGDFALLAPHLREVLLFPGDLLHRPGEQIKQVYFLQSGMVSLMVILENGRTVETVSVGHEGAIGTIEGFGALHAFTAARVQVSGVASRVPGAIFRRILNESSSLKEAINHYHMTVMAHLQQTAACNAVHDLTSRLSRILLLSADRCNDHIQLSHESLAEMLGVRRSSVTIAASALRDSGAIEYRRADIRILDRQKLEKTVCECYPTIRRTIDAGFWKPQSSPVDEPRGDGKA